MIQQLTPLGVHVPGGFAVSSDAYDAVLDQAGLKERLQTLMKDLEGRSTDRVVCS
jgi:pyruvate, water dikinase